MINDESVYTNIYTTRRHDTQQQKHRPTPFGRPALAVFGADLLLHLLRGADVTASN